MYRKALFLFGVNRGLFLAAFLLSGTSLPATDKLPLETFARFPAIYHPTISRDGKTLCYVASFGDDRAVVFKDLDGGENYSAKDGWGYPRWVAEDRVIFSELYGIAAIDRDTGNPAAGMSFMRDGFATGNQWIYPEGVLFDRYVGKKSGTVLVNAYDLPAREDALSNFPNVAELDTRSATFHQVLKNPGRVVSWLSDGAGVIRVGMELDENALRRVIFRNAESEPWRVVAGLDWAKRSVRLLHLSVDGATLYVSLVTPAGTWGVYSYDLAKQKLGELILSHNQYDILPYGYTVEQDGFALEQVVVAPKTREVLGIQYVTDVPKALWFDPQLAQVQAALDQNLPNRTNTIVSLSDNLQRLIVLSWSPTDFGTYYLFDLSKKQLIPLFKRAPWMKPEQMAEVKPVSYTSRDGLTIHGYLTLPRGAPKQKLPLVVYPHGGPWVRDAYDFDYDVQFLANRGYAVLQMNYRGSTGYGEAFAKKGLRNIGRGIQDDIEDGTRWAITQGIADPGRIAIMGWSFGGYSAAIGPMRSPDLYRCAINMAGVTDWKAQMKYIAEDSPLRRKVNADYVGDPVADAAELDDISPVRHADKLRVPMLLVYGKSDQTVPYDQMKRFTKALDKAGKHYEVLTRRFEGHGFTDVKDRTELYKTIEAFLAKNMAPK